MDYEATDKWMQHRLDTWFENAKASLDRAEITELAYEQRDLEDTAGALRDLGKELYELGHERAAAVTRVAAMAVQKAANTIGEIDG